MCNVIGPPINILPFFMIYGIKINPRELIAGASNEDRQV